MQKYFVEQSLKDSEVGWADKPSAFVPSLLPSGVVAGASRGGQDAAQQLLEEE
jgi:hypothetical protein